MKLRRMKIRRTKKVCQFFGATRYKVNVLTRILNIYVTPPPDENSARVLYTSNIPLSHVNSNN